MNKNISHEGWEDNRYKKLRSNKSKFYCSCDMEMQGKGQKCSKSGKMTDKRKLKKY